MFPEKQLSESDQYYADPLDEQQQIHQYYKYHEDQINEKFMAIRDDTIENLKNKMKKKQQSKYTMEENLKLIENQRNRILADMMQHVNQKKCGYPECEKVEEITMKYGIYKGEKEYKHDIVHFIVERNIKGLGSKIIWECPEANKLNQKMKETHKIKIGM